MVWLNAFFCVITFTSYKDRKLCVLQQMLWIIFAVFISIVLFAVYIQPRFVVRYLAKTYPAVLFNVNTDSKFVALTIDDGPSSKVTPQILDTLKKYNVKATFFLIGSQIAGNEKVLQR